MGMEESNISTDVVGSVGECEKKWREDENPGTSKKCCKEQCQ